MNAKMFFKVFLKSLPLGLGIVLALISITYIVDGGDENNIMPAIIFGVIGFPMLIAGALKLVKEFNLE